MVILAPFLVVLSNFVQLKLFKLFGVELQQRVGAGSKPNLTVGFACLRCGAWGGVCGCLLVCLVVVLFFLLKQEQN